MVRLDCRRSGTRHFDERAANHEVERNYRRRSGRAKGASRESVSRRRNRPSGSCVHFASAPKRDDLSGQEFSVTAQYGSGQGPLSASKQMTFTPSVTSQNPIRNLRWWIGGLLFASTVINYIDRQTLSNLAPYLKQDFHWTNTDYANVVIAFRIAYTLGQAICGRMIDRV